MTESWLPVRGFEGHYEVSDLGRVRSLPRTGGGGKPGCRGRAGQILKPHTDTNGYPQVKVWLDGKPYLRRVHALVAEAFIGPRPEGLEVCHRDGNPGNCLPGNLHYGTRVDNMQDCLRHGRNRNARKTHCKRGHELAGPNLDAGFLERHQGRRCLSCARGLANVRAAEKFGLELDIQIEADRHYDLLMSR